jgi:hypothetical protein
MPTVLLSLYGELDMAAVAQGMRPIIIQEENVSRQLVGGPLDGRIIWTRPSEKVIRLILLDKPFNMDGCPGEEAVYLVSGNQANFVGTEPAIST